MATRWIDETESAEDLAATVAALRSRGWRMTLHANSAAAVDLALDALSETALSGAPLDVSDGVERRSALRPEVWARIRRLGISAGLTVDEGYDGPFDPGPLDVPASLARDAMAGPPDPLQALAAAKGADRSVRASAWLPGVTLDAAARCGGRAILGSIEVGKYADFAFLGSAHGEIDLSDLAQVQCEATWIGGREIRR